MWCRQKILDSQYISKNKVFRVELLQLIKEINSGVAYAIIIGGTQTISAYTNYHLIIMALPELLQNPLCLNCTVFVRESKSH